MSLSRLSGADLAWAPPCWAALEHLRCRGARSMLLGVDADDPAPVALYHSVGFKMIDGLEVWEGCGTTVGALNVGTRGRRDEY